MVLRPSTKIGSFSCNFFVKLNPHFQLAKHKWLPFHYNLAKFPLPKFLSLNPRPQYRWRHNRHWVLSPSNSPLPLHSPRLLQGVWLEAGPADSLLLLVLLPLRDKEVSLLCDSPSERALSHTHTHIPNRGLFSRGAYFTNFSRNENFREDCTSEITMLGMWVWFSIISVKIHSMNCSNFEICEVYTPRK